MLTFACPSRHAVFPGGGYKYLGPFSDFGISEDVLMEVVIQRSGDNFTFSVNDKVVTRAQVPSGKTIDYLGLLPALSSTTFRIYH